MNGLFSISISFLCKTKIAKKILRNIKYLICGNRTPNLNRYSPALPFAELLYPPVPPLNEVQFAGDEAKIVLNSLGDRIGIEQRGIQPKLDFLIIIRYSVLEEEQVNKAFEIDEQIEEPDVGRMIQTLIQRT